MKKMNQLLSYWGWIAISLFGVLLLLCSVSSADPISFAADSAVFPGEVVVKFVGQISPQITAEVISTGIPSVDDILEDLPLKSLKRALPGVEVGNSYGLDRVWSLEFDAAVDLLPILEALSADSHIEYAEPRYLRYPDRNQRSVAWRSIAEVDSVPNDPSYGQQWALPRIVAPQAWDITQGDPGVVIAIVDAGTDMDHPDLAANLWQNDAELNGSSGVDDDGNGFIDDYYGWDFMDSDGYPEPQAGDHHGTHTAGIASAVTNNGEGIAGVGWNCKIMAVRTGDGLYIYYGIEGINYAALTGARVISCSWGGPGSSQYEQDVINDATSRGALVVAAAGNESSSALHFPSAYENVTAVAATTPSDNRSSYSNYGEWVDCCAPGDVILSTIIGGYGFMSGTSMSCPHVAGLAGLIAAMHPEWTPDRVEAQILSTCDNIDDLNPLYAGLLGAGRINAYRAVTESNPYVVISDDGFADGDGDGVIEPGESVDFWVELTNLLEPVNNVQGTITTDDPYVTITQDQASFGDLNTGSSASNQAAPFSFDLTPTVPGSHQITFTLQISGEGGYTGTDYVRFTVLPVYGDHDVGNVVLTVTNFGSLGFYDYALSGLSIGSGFQYPAGSPNALFHGSVMVGTSQTAVSDNCYGNDTFDSYDFRVVEGGELFIQQGTLADQEGMAIFNDNGSTQPIGVQITQRSYSWADPPDDDFVIMRYDILNTSGATLNNLYVSIYLDWDVEDYTQNMADWDADSAVGYMRNDTSPYYGLCLVSHEAASYRAVENAAYIYTYQYTDALKYDFMTEGFVVTASPYPEDWSMQLSAGPFEIAAGEAETVAFAILGGDDMNDLRQNVGQARLRWQDLILNVPLAEPTAQPLEFALCEAYPNPFNPATTVSYILPVAAQVSLQAYDLSGCLVANLVQGWQTAGIHRVNFNAGTDLTSGIYFLRLQAGNYMGTQKIVLMK